MQNNQPQIECNHILGLLRHTDYCELVDFERLAQHIRHRIEWNEMLRHDPNFAELMYFAKPEFTMCDYADWRRSTNLTRFKHCPMCGSRIDWKSLKNYEV